MDKGSAKRGLSLKVDRQRSAAQQHQRENKTVETPQLNASRYTHTTRGNVRYGVI